MYVCVYVCVCIYVCIQVDQNFSVHLMITGQKTRKHMATTEYIRNVARAILNTVFGVSINVWILAGHTLNITCNFLYCNHQVHRDFFLSLCIRTRGLVSLVWLWLLTFIFNYLFIHSLLNDVLCSSEYINICL
jgi:hypothetical protein